MTPATGFGRTVSGGENERSRADTVRGVNQVTATLDQKFGDTVKVGSVVGHADSAFSNPVQTTVTLDAIDTNNFQYDFTTRFPAIRPGSSSAGSSIIRPSSAGSWRKR